MPNISTVATLTQSERWIFQFWLSGNLPVHGKDFTLRSWLADIGIYDEPDHYSILDAAIARILVGWQADQFSIASTDEPSEPRNPHPSQSLFSINWANGPTTDWRAGYDLFWVPEFGRHVIVTSADAEPFGYSNFALGHFSSNDSLLQATESIIVANWTSLMVDCNQERWCECWAGELVTASEAQRWADQVWVPFSEDDDAEEVGSD